MKDSKVKILNVGPIKEVDLTLNKINIFMGGQSSGKSTISKIVSYCNWVEKDVAFHQSFSNYSTNNKYFIEKLEVFHKMKGYFREDSEIIYESDVIKMHYQHNSFYIGWKDQYSYKRSKISYIPSERNIVILPEMEKVELVNNNMRSFLFDWFDARKNYTIENQIPILNLGIKYYYSESTKENHIVGSNQNGNNNEEYDILLSNGSSGVQSITPLIIMIDYLTNKIYDDELNKSYDSDKTRIEVEHRIFTELVLNPLGYSTDSINANRRNIFSDLSSRLAEGDEIVKDLMAKCETVIDNLFDTNRSDLIIEEPEQNLFPSTQKCLVYELLKSLKNDKDNNLILTTHSPYILYAINNCIMADIVNDNLSYLEKNKLNCLESKINPESISIYEIKNGFVNCIQESDGLIGENFFDSQMKDVMDEFYLMLNHY